MSTTGIWVTAVAMSMLVGGAQADTINWGNAFDSSVVQSDGTTSWDESMTIQLGRFDTGFEATPANADQWAAHWTAFDTVNGLEFNIGAGFFQSSAVLSDNSVFQAGDRAFVWVFNSVAAQAGSEWLLFTNSSADGNAGDDWRFPTVSGSQQTLPLNWRVSNATVAVFGAFVTSPAGGSATVGGGVRTPPPESFDLQTATFAAVPEPGIAVLLAAGAAAFCRRRRKIAAAIAAGAFGLGAPVQADITGKVFRDFDANGTQEALEPGVAGVTVTAYNASNAVAATAVTGTSGSYTLPLAAGPVRVEISNLPAHLKPGVSGASKPTVFFAANGDTAQNVALQNPSDFSDATSELATPCYVNGDPVPPGSGSASMAWLVRFPWSPASLTGLNDYLATGETIGATWGLAWQRSTRTLFSAAVLKRHSGLGSGGIDAIYRTVETPTGPQSSLFLKLGTYGISAGTDPRVPGDLTTVPTSPNHDANTFDAVGKRGLGDLDISEDDRTLWAINLQNRSLVEIPIGSPAAVPAPGTVIEHTLPAAVSPAVTNGVLRPWAIGIKDGFVYVGATATAESTGGTAAHLRAYILRHDPAGAVGNFSQVYDFPLNYSRGHVSNDTSTPSTTSAAWRPWIDAWADIVSPAPGAATWNQTICPQPLLSDIEFDTDGSMILGFSDRFGFQIGNYNYSPVASDTATYEGAVGGDILRLFKTTTGYALENNATAPLGSANAGATTTGTSTGGSPTTPAQGPGGGEWYWQDMYAVDANKNNGSHMEITLGGLASRYSTGTVASTVFDPGYDFRAGGTAWFSNATGSRTNSYQVFGVDEGGGPSTFGKSSGLGDLELLTDPVPLQIGDLVWNDANRNGRQDPGEAGLPTVTLQLWEDTNGDGTVDTQVGQTVTDGSGNYMFGGMAGTGMLPCGLGPERAVSATIAQSADDAEQNMSTNAVNITDTVLDVARTAGSVNQTVGLRFCNLAIPQGAQIESASVQFASQAADSTTANIAIRAQNADTAAAFAATASNLSSRATTTSSVIWSPQAWSVTPLTGKTSGPQKTPDLSTLVQEVVNRAGWSPGNCLAFLMSNSSGTGLRRAYSYDNTPGRAPALSIRYRTTELCRIVPGRKYEVRLPSGQGSLGSLVATLSHADVSRRDSDAVLSGANFATTITAESGRNDHTLDFGFTAPTVSIGNLVFCDLNNDGLFDPDGADNIPGNADDETGLDGVTLEACDPGPDGAVGGTDDVHGPSVTTSGGGHYLISGLAPGKWYVKIVSLPPGKDLTSSPYAGSDNQTDNDDNGTQVSGPGSLIHSPVITLATGAEPGPAVDGDDTDTDGTIDFGLVPSGTISGAARVDYDADGHGDTPLPGVTFTLCDALSGQPIDNPNLPGLQDYTVESPDGYYLFTGLYPGSYIVKETQPAGYVTLGDYDGTPDPTDSPADPVNVSGDDLIGVVLGTGETDTANNFDEGLPVSVGNLVFCDANANGLRDEGEPGINGVELALLLDADRDGDIEGPELTPIGTAHTLGGGNYGFNNLRPGTYRIVVTAVNFTGGPLAGKSIASPLGFTGHDDDGVDNDSNGLQTAPSQPSLSPSITLVPGQEPPGIGGTSADTTIDFGFYEPASLSGVVLLDTDYDGLGNPDAPLAGVELQLFTPGSEGPNPYLNPLTGEPWTTTTAADGSYSFGPLPVGNYLVRQIQPVDYQTVTDGDTTDGADDGLEDFPDLPGDNRVIVTLLPGETDTGNDFVERIPPGSICGTVTGDLDGDGFADTSIEGVSLLLVTPAGGLVDDPSQPDFQPFTATTDSSGSYCFTGVPPGLYKVVEIQPLGWVSLSDLDGGNPDELGTAEPIEVLPDSIVAGQDFAELIAATLGDRVFFDANDNGRIDPGEQGIPDVTVELCTAAGDPIDEDLLTDGIQPTTVATDEAGYYGFGNLAPGTYVVKIANPPATAPVSSTGSQPYISSEPDLDRGVQPVPGGPVTSLPVTLNAGQSVSSVDFGFYAPLTLGNLVFCDTDLSGTADAGEGVDGVTVVLLADLNDDGDLSDAGENSPVATTITAGGGYYSFTGLAPGHYIVKLPAANFAAGQPLTGKLGIPGTQDGDDNDGEDGLDAPNPASTGIASDIVSLISGAAPADAEQEGGLGSTSDDADDPNGDLTVDFGFQPMCPTTFAAFQAAWPLVVENSPWDNPDGDIHDNLLEFALCEDPSSGVRTSLGFCVDPHPVTGLYRVRFRRPIGIQNTTYTLEIIDDLADAPAGWADVTTPPSSVTPNPDGTETVEYLDIESEPGLTGSRGFVRLRIDSTAPAATSRSEVMGWTDYTANSCATFSNPFLKKEIFSGTVTSGSTTLDVAASVGTSSLPALLNPLKCYFIEVVDGPYEGQRFEVLPAATTATSIRLVGDAGTNTLSPIPSLASASIVLREHFTFRDLFPTSALQSGGSVTEADNILGFTNGVGWSTWFVSNSSPPGIWVNADDPYLKDTGDLCVPSGTGLFFHRRGTPITLSFHGAVRDTAFAMPLPAGCTLVGSAYPVTQTPASRRMTTDNGFTGSRDLNSADQVYLWKGDQSPGQLCYITSWLLDASDPYRYWIDSDDVTATSQNDLELFQPLRSAFHCEINPVPTWILPPQWTSGTRRLPPIE